MMNSIPEDSIEAPSLRTKPQWRWSPRKPSRKHSTTSEKPRKRLSWIWAGLRWLWKGTGFQGKTLWDWLQLIFVSLALAGLGFWFTQETQSHQQQVSTEQNRAAVLRDYLDTMSD